MTDAIASELLKLRTTRTFLALVLAAVLLSTGPAALVAALDPFEGVRTVPPGEDIAGFAGFMGIFALVLGILAVTTEFRHGTITPTLLAVPSRTRLMTAKLAAHLLAGFGLGLLATLLTVAVVEAILGLRGIESGTTVLEPLRWALGFGAATALLAGFGVGLGAIVRNQVGAIVGTFAWLLVVEPLLTIARPLEQAITKFGLGGVSDGVDGNMSQGTGDLLAQLPATLVMSAYVAVVVIVGIALLRRRDIA